MDLKPQNENIRYSRQVAIPEIGETGQRKLRQSKVFIVGCGALGSMCAMQLAGAGIGKIGFADFDTIDISNLQRQFFFFTEEAGISKAQILRERIKGLNPEIEVEVYHKLVTYKIAEEIFPHYDFIIDATDNPDSKGLVDEVAGRCGKACTLGGVKDFRGQVMTLLPGDRRFYEIFGKAGQECFLPCSLGGVAGPAAALCASVQASEAIKYVTGTGELLRGRLLIFNLLKGQFKTFEI